MSISDRLEQITARADAADKGPWKFPHRDYPGVVMGKHGCLWHPDLSEINDPVDAEFIAAARTDVPALVAALRAVLDVCDKALAVTVAESSESDVAMAAFAAVTQRAIADNLGEGA